MSAFHKHESTQSHKESLVYWQSYKASTSQGRVVQKLEAANVEEIRQRREYVRRIVAVTCMLGKQGIPFRGHNESEDSDNNRWYNPPYSPRTVLIQSEQKGWQNHSGPRTSSILPL